MDPLTPSFEVESGSGAAAARVGRLTTPHGVLETPAFFPVGTFGAVRGLSPEELRSVGVQGVLANTYHLHLRPGEDLIRELGGLHDFMGWSGPLLTDSGGFQVHSLGHLCERSEAGVHFQSPIDGSERSLTPESAIAIQEALGADLVVVLDEFEPISDDPSGEQLIRLRAGMERTLRWAERSRAAQQRKDQLLFGVVQGGGSAELRAESAERTAELGFPAHAIGGLGVGETAEQRLRLLEACLAWLPELKPRYLMGLGFPNDLVDAIARGVDLFDCVIPTRHGRHGVVFAPGGPLNLRNARFRTDAGPIDEDCACAACRGHSRAYLRHLIVSGEALGARLASLHNLAFYMALLRRARAAIVAGRFEEWRRDWSERYGRDESGGARSSGSSAATHSAA